VQIELKTLGISPRRAMEQIVDYKNDPGNGYTKTLLCFLQLFDQPPINQAGSEVKILTGERRGHGTKTVYGGRDHRAVADH